MGQASAEDHAVAVSGDNHGQIVIAEHYHVHYDASQLRRNVSLLSQVVAHMAQVAVASYGVDRPWVPPPEAEEKIAANKLLKFRRQIAAHLQFLLHLEGAFSALEQSNMDGRRLVHLWAHKTYEDVLHEVIAGQNLGTEPAVREFSRQNADQILGLVIDRLQEETLAALASLDGGSPPKESVYFGVLLVVIDAVIECSVLEWPENVAAA